MFFPNRLYIIGSNRFYIFVKKAETEKYTKDIGLYEM